MKQPKETAPEGYEAFERAVFVGRRVECCQHGDPPDMLLKQTYNAKEESVLDGITDVACIQLVYTKSVMVAVFLQLKSMLHLSKDTTTLIISQVNHMW